MKTNYSATFADGSTITRKSHRVYTHAWQAEWQSRGIKFALTGFAGSAELARKAAQVGARATSSQDGLKIEVVEVKS
jgi:hypothetical protein